MVRKERRDMRMCARCEIYEERITTVIRRGVLLYRLVLDEVMQACGTKTAADRNEIFLRLDDQEDAVLAIVIKLRENVVWMDTKCT